MRVDEVFEYEALTDAERIVVDDAAFADYDIERRGAWLAEKYLELLRKVS